MTKIGPLLFFLTAGFCPAQFIAGHCCSPEATPAQMDRSQLTPVNVPIESKAADAPSGESVSAARLLHNPTRKARNAFIRGVKLSNTRDYSRAAAEFAAAIGLDPDFSEAHGNLAVEYTWLGRLDESVPEFQRALQLDAATALHHANFSFVLIQLNRWSEAEAEAQTAVGLDPGDAVAQFFSVVCWRVALRHEISPKIICCLPRGAFPKLILRSRGSIAPRERRKAPIRK